jgi:hypothetical protein
MPWNASMTSGGGPFGRYGFPFSSSRALDLIGMDTYLTFHERYGYGRVSP